MSVQPITSQNDILYIGYNKKVVITKHIYTNLTELICPLVSVIEGQLRMVIEV